MSLFLGNPTSGDPEKFYIEPFHTLIAGQTNLSGKTTTAIALASEAVKQDYTVLFFDTKPTLREFEGFHDIPICYQPTTDPLVLMGLLEAVRHARLSPLYATLGRISEGAKTVKDIIENSKVMEARSRSGFIKDACYTLRDLLERLDAELSNFRLSETLDLRDRTINVMPINALSNEAQQLVVKTALELVIRKHNKKTIVIVDEAFRFFPQDYGSACKKAGMDVITQGAKTGLFIWICTQFLATTEKDIMKPCANKILGRQDHNTEIEALMKLVPHAKSLINADEIMTLKRGEFIFVPLEGKPVKLKVVPLWERISQAKIKTRPKVQVGPIGTQPGVPVPLVRSREVEVIGGEPVVPTGNPSAQQTIDILRSNPVIQTQRSVVTVIIPTDAIHPLTALGKLGVIMKDDAKHNQHWGLKRAKKQFENRQWSAEGLEEAFNQMITLGVLRIQSNRMYTFTPSRVEITEKTVNVIAP